LHRRRRGRHGEPRRLHPGLDLHQPARSLRVALGEPGPGRHLLLRGPDSDPAPAADRTLRAHAQMSPRFGYWTGFSIVVAVLVAAPLVLPEFWRRFVTEILIWG